MLLNLSLYTVGIAAALVTEYVASKTTSGAAIHAECLCWASLAAILYVRRHVVNRHRQMDDTRHGFEDAATMWNPMLWAVSFCIAVARIMPLHYNMASALPLVTAVTACASIHRDLRTSSALPGPGSPRDVSATMAKGGMRMRWLRIGTIVLLAVWGYFLLLPQFKPNYSYMVCIAFVVARSASFILIEACKARDISPTDRADAYLYTAEAIVSRVFSITLAFMLFFPPQTTFAWPMLVQALFNIIELGANFYLVIFGCMVSATTIDAYSVTAIQSFVAEVAPQMPTISIGSFIILVQGIIGLPPSTSTASRRLLLALIVVLTLPIINNELRISRTVWSRYHGVSGSGLVFSMHPIAYLASEADAKFRDMVSRQSDTLHAACAEYKRRYGRRPPPNFDRWYKAANESGFLLIDEFDTMMAAIEPLWGAPAADIASRVENALQAGHMSMIRFEIKDHQVSYSMENFAAWMAQQMDSWFNQEMLETLPDLVFGVNIKDEPKVVVPHDGLEHALAKAQDLPTKADPALSESNSDLSRRVHFLEVGGQNAWEALTMSCPFDSPARSFLSPTTDPSRIAGPGFLSNVTLSKDVCLFPELRNLHAALLAPASLAITHSLVPIFSQAKLSCFQDLLYPSPWYAAKLDMLEYNEADDMDWEQKANKFYWVGSTTGGHSTMENWRSGQRQRLALLAMDSNGPITLLRKPEMDGRQNSDIQWEASNSTMAEISSLLDIRISAVIQCEQDACEDQEATFKIEPDSRDDVSTSYASRYNLDLDGNGFSGRFYRLLRSKSAVIKQTLYKEWHDDWLIPWVHYIPLSMDLSDFPEIVRYLTQEPDGQALGKKVADEGRKWANTVLRKEDMTLVFWRLLLEYARVLDENRDHLECCADD